MHSNYKAASACDCGELMKIAELSLDYPKVGAQYYVRIYSLLGIEGSKTYEGYEFFIHDTKNDIKFSLALTGFGLGFWAAENSDKTQSSIGEFNEFLFTNVTELKDCSYDFEHDFGITSIGCKNGEVFQFED